MNSFIWGVGTSRFGRQPEKSGAQLVWEAVTEAVADAGVRSFDAIYVGSCFGEPGVAPRVLAGLGLTGVPIYSMESACASSSSALHEANHAVRSERYGTVLVIGVDHLSSRFTGAIEVDMRDVEGRSGLALPALYAMSATRYQEVYGLKPEVLAGVSVKNHRHGVDNERAQYVEEVTLEQVLASRMIADPLLIRKVDCPNIALLVLGKASSWITRSCSGSTARRSPVLTSSAWVVIALCRDAMEIGSQERVCWTKDRRFSGRGHLEVAGNGPTGPLCGETSPSSRHGNRDAAREMKDVKT